MRVLEVGTRSRAYPSRAATVCAISIHLLLLSWAFGGSHLSHKTSISHIQRNKEAGLGSEGPVQERPLRGARQVWEGEETRISLVLSALLCLQVEEADGKEG